MGLAEYKKKRNFRQTPEPSGRAGAKAGGGLRYVIQKHDASRLHYDFRLELDGVLKSWAVPKGPSLDPRRKSLAVQVEDHPIEYGDFEGVIPKGQYGGGTVLLWDRGTWEPKDTDPAAALKNGRLHFTLHGEKLQGEWALVRMGGKAGGDGKNWLLMKLKDRHAGGRDILTEAPDSVKTKRSLDSIAGARDDVWSDQAKQTGRLAGAAKSREPAAITPQLAVPVESPPAGEDWLHEIKFDGYRILAHVKSGRVRLITRNGKDWTARFSKVAEALSKLKVDSAILDGEVVVLDANGRSDFQALQMSLMEKSQADPVYMVFDLPFLDGFDLRDTPLIERKKQLQTVLDRSRLNARVRFSDHVLGDGGRVVEKACAMGLEGVVSKRTDAPYVSRRDSSWVKSKCVQRQEFVVIGWTPPRGSRTGFGSLLLGYHDPEGRLVYAGRVGTGFDERLLTKTLHDLESLQRKDSPTTELPPVRERRNASWAEPKLVAEVKFTAWTRDGMLRHPVFVGFRSDKPASEIVRESPVEPEQLPEPATASERKSRRKPMAKSTAKKSGSAKPSAPATTSGSEKITVAGVTLSHPDREFYPDSGVTKRVVAEYYAAVEKWMLPHVTHRPLALVRCPEGMSSKCFFQRNWSPTLPKAIHSVNVGEGKKEMHVCVHDLAGIVALTQIGVLEIHIWNCREPNVRSPDQLVFDLDPGPDVSWKQVIEATREVRKTLESVGLATFLKTSGGKGLHIVTPIEPNIDWATAKSFSGTIARSLAARDDRFVANMRKDLRGGKVYLDFNRNDRTATAVAPYSTRARAGAPVSMPISWEELGKLKSADHFTVDTAGRYLKQRKTDPWRRFEESRVDLRKLKALQSAA